MEQRRDSRPHIVVVSVSLFSFGLPKALKKLFRTLRKK